MIPGSLNTMMMRETDPYWNNVSSLLHFDGTDTSTTFTDETGKTWAANGDAQIDTAKSKFGGASGLFDGTTDWISTAKSADFEFGAGDFTIEGWVDLDDISFTQALLYYGKITAVANTDYAFTLIQQASGGGGGLIFTANDAAGAQTNTISNTDLTVGSMQFVQLVRESGVVKIRLGGTQIASGADTTNHNVTVDHVLLLGRRGSFAVSYLDGHMDDWRITKGIARANVVPTQAFPN